jgi:hypothetical protein
MAEPDWLKELKKFDTAYDLRKQKELSEKLKKIIDSKRLKYDPGTRQIQSSTDSISVPEPPSQELTNTSIVYR